MRSTSATNLAEAGSVVASTKPSTAVLVAPSRQEARGWAGAKVGAAIRRNAMAMRSMGGPHFNPDETGAPQPGAPDLSRYNLRQQRGLLSSARRHCFEMLVTASIALSRLKLPGFWRGGNSRKLC